MTHTDGSNPKLTKRQQEILQLIHAHMAATGSSPTRAEIAKQMGFRSPNAAEDHLRALARKGVIELVSGTSRGIRVPRQSCSVPVIKLALPYTEALLNPASNQETYLLDPRLFKASVDFLVLVNQKNHHPYEAGDYVAIHQTQQFTKGQTALICKEQRLSLEPFSESLHTAIAHYQLSLEGIVLGFIRNLDTEAPSS